MARKKAIAGIKQRALVVGVSKYAPPVPPLPAVANDVKEMAKLLSSKHGAFSKETVNVLTDKLATKSAVIAGLTDTLASAKADDTVFAYLAGHGTVIGSDYYFLPFDTDVADVETSCVPLATIKDLFDKSKSRRVFLWLDFCHSGGILSRNITSAAPIASIKRTLKVTQGQGKVIVAACTSSQSSFESSTIGHGLFTDALLRGLKGEAKSAQGEVTASSLYDFIDHQIVRPDQQPVFFGEMTGRIVLMHYASRVPNVAKTKTPTKTVTAKPSRNTIKGTWIMLGENFFVAERVRNQADGKISVELTPRSGQEESQIAELRPGQYRNRQELGLAVNNDAYEVIVEDVVSEHVGAHQKWTLTLKTQEQLSGVMTEMTINGVGPDEIAAQRAGRILINDPPPKKRSRGFSDDSFFEGAITGSSGKHQIDGCVVQKVYKQHGDSPSWKEMARLKSVYLLKMSNTVEHVIDLKIGTVRGNKVKVTFKGRRPRRYSNEEPVTLALEGVCDLS